MPDALGWRCRFGVITPSPNTVVQPEYDAMRPVGVTNHLSRMHIEVPPVSGDEAFRVLVQLIDEALEPAAERVLEAVPDHMILGVSVEAIWHGVAGVDRVRQRLVGQTGLPCTTAAEAVLNALQLLGNLKRVAVISPYTESGNAAVQRWFAECGISAPRAMRILMQGPPKRFSWITAEEIRATLRAVDGDDVDAIVQFGANVPMARLVPETEHWLGKPVLAINTVTYWQALRAHGIADRMPGFGMLMERH